MRRCTHHLNTFDGGVSRLHGFKSSGRRLSVSVCHDRIQSRCSGTLNLSVFNVRRAPAFAFEQSKRATIGGRFIRVDESRDLPLLHVVEDFTQKPVCSFAVTTGRRDKIDSAARAVDGPAQIRPAAIDLHVGFIHVPRAKIGRVTPVPAQPFFHFRAHNAEPSGKSWSDRHSLRVQPASPAAHGN